MKYKIILNPVSGKGKGIKAERLITEVLNKQKLEFEIVHTKEPFHGIELARQAVKDGWPAIIAAGGDGTMGEVLNGLMAEQKEETHFGFIPTGTGNDFARSLNIPLDMKEAVDLLVNPGVKLMDIGKEREGYFAIITGLGFPAEVMAAANNYKGPLRGPLVITWSVIRTIRELKPQRVELTLDNEKKEMDIKAIFVLNTPFTGGGLNIAPEAKIDDGFLDIVVIKGIGKLDLLMTLPKTYKGKHVGHPGIEFFRSKKVKIETDRPLKKLFDGNVYGNSPIEAEVLPLVLPVLVPAKRR